MGLIPLAKPYMDENIKKAVSDVLDSGSYINGENVKKFEKEFARSIGVKHAIAVNSGSSALFLSLLDIGLQKGDEFICPSLSFVATASQGMMLGAKPVFVDVDPFNYTIDVKQIEEKITEKTKAIIPVHLYGHSADMNPIIDVGDKYGIPIIEDACQSYGTRYKGAFTGSMGDYGVFSFYPSKTLTVCMDGGMITTNDYNIAKNLKILRDHGRYEKYTHRKLGMNMRMSEISAVIGLGQLKMMPYIIERKKELTRWYHSLLENTLFVELQRIEDWCDPSFYVFTIRPLNRIKVREALEIKGIQTGIQYPTPIHKQPMIYDEGYKLPHTEAICDTILSIPFHHEVTYDDAEYISKTIKGIDQNGKN